MQKLNEGTYRNRSAIAVPVNTNIFEVTEIVMKKYKIPKEIRLRFLIFMIA